MRWRLLVLFALALAALPLMPGTSHGQELRLAWARVEGLPDNVDFWDVFLVDQNSAWAVGAVDVTEGVAYRFTFRDGRWQATEDARFRAQLYSVVVLPGGEVWAVGDNGLIVQRDARGWQEIANPQPGAELRTLQMFGAGEEGWAGGSRYDENREQRGVLLHYTGGQWRVDDSVAWEPRSWIERLHFAPGGGWAVGNHIWRYHDGTWREEPSDVCGGVFCFTYFFGIRAIDGEHAWAAGQLGSMCLMCGESLFLLQHTPDGWHRYTGELEGYPQYSQFVGPQYSSLTSVAFSDADHGLAIGHRTTPEGLPHVQNFALRYQQGVWRYEAIGEEQRLLSLVRMSMLDPEHVLAVGRGGLAFSYGYGTPPPGAPGPRQPIEDPHAPGVAYFAPTGHTLRGAFRQYWEQHGGLAQFGYPLTEEFAENGFTLQYFERARFEHHPENQPPYHVLLGLLGRTVTARREGEPPFRPTGPNPAIGAHYFPETGHTIAAQFEGYWSAHGGLPVYGYPISEPFEEVNPADGQIYLVQYYERNRFELHPELPEPYRVSLGLLGRAVLERR